MLITIIIIALIIGVFFVVTAIALAGFVYNGMKQKSDLQKKCLRILIPAAIVWLLLIGVNAVLISVYLYNNSGEVLELFKQFLELLKK